MASKETANPRTWRLRPVMGSHWRHTRLQLEFTRSEGEGEFFHSQETVRRMLGAVFQTTCIHCEPRVQKRHATAALLYRAKQRLKVRWSRLRWSLASGAASALDDSKEDSDHRQCRRWIGPAPKQRRRKRGQIGLGLALVSGHKIRDRAAHERRPLRRLPRRRGRGEEIMQLWFCVEVRCRARADARSGEGGSDAARGSYFLFAKNNFVTSLSRQSGGGIYPHILYLVGRGSDLEVILVVIGSAQPNLADHTYQYDTMYNHFQRAPIRRRDVSPASHRFYGRSEVSCRVVESWK